MNENRHATLRFYHIANNLQSRGACRRERGSDLEGEGPGHHRDCGSRGCGVFCVRTLREAEYPIADVKRLNILTLLNDFAGEVLSHRQRKIRWHPALEIALADFPIDRVYSSIPNPHQ